MKPALSTCHQAPVKVVGGDEGTNHYECTFCSKPCDTVAPRGGLDEILEQYFPLASYGDSDEAKQAIVEAVEGIYGDSDGLREFASTGSNQVVTSGANKRLGLPFGKMRKITIAVDVDGTLRSNLDNSKVIANEDIRNLVRILQKFKNTRLVLWSGSGELYARQVANELGIAQWFDSFASKTDHEVINADIAIDDIQDTAIGKINLIVREK